MQYLMTFKEYIDYYLRNIPRDVVQPLRVPMRHLRRAEYHNDCYLRFWCQDCDKEWSSTMGHCYIPFRIYGPGWKEGKLKKEKQSKVKHIKQFVTLEYDFYFMRQKCQICKEWGEHQLPKYQKGRISDNFAVFIDGILKNQIRPLKKNEKRNKKMADSHKVELCEACILGKCREKRVVINGNVSNQDSSSSSQNQENQENQQNQPNQQNPPNRPNQPNQQLQQNNQNHRNQQDQQDSGGDQGVQNDQNNQIMSRWR